MLGKFDEYKDSEDPYRDPVNTGTVMDDESTNIPGRLMTRIADNIGTLITDADGNFITPM